MVESSFSHQMRVNMSQDKRCSLTAESPQARPGRYLANRNLDFIHPQKNSSGRVTDGVLNERYGNYSAFFSLWVKPALFIFSLSSLVILARSSLSSLPSLLVSYLANISFWTAFCSSVNLCFSLPSAA